MNLFTAIFSLSMSFVLFIYLYGLQVTYSTKFNVIFYLFPIILLVLSLYCFNIHFPEKSKNKKNLNRDI